MILVGLRREREGMLEVNPVYCLKQNRQRVFLSFNQKQIIAMVYSII